MPDVAVKGLSLQTKVGSESIGATGDNTVVINGRDVMRVTDKFESHIHPGGSPHVPVLVEGSSIMFVNQQAVSYVGCKTDCDSVVKNGDSVLNIEQ
jgi:uncharacterized Zn-binding protein involved in type VI secretion